MKKTTLLALSLIVSLAPIAFAAEGHPESHNVSQMKLIKFPGFPTCVSGAVLSGDPAKGPVIVYGKMSAGCVIPWHWHTPNESLMMISGTAHIDVKGEKAVTLKPGGFSMLPSHHQHNFRCPSACSLYVYADAGAFDIHYVDKDGNEISPADALKKVKEKTITPSE